VCTEEKLLSEERLLLKIVQNRKTIRHNEFIVNILEGTISGKRP